MGDSSLKIYASRNQAAPGDKITLVAEKITRDGERITVKPVWHAAKRKGITVDEDGVLTVCKSVQLTRSKKFPVVAEFEGMKAEKEIILVPKDQYKGKKRVGYFRFNGSYDGWNIWIWDDRVKAHGIPFTEKFDLGVAGGVDGENIIIRLKDWWAKETGDISLKDKNEVFIVQGDPVVYTDFREALKATRPRVYAALMDEKRLVKAYLTSEPPQGITFGLYMDGKAISKGEAHGTKVVLKVPHDYDFDPSALYEVRASRMFSPGKVTLRRVLDHYHYKGGDMGAVFDKGHIRLRVWAPTASKVGVMLYDRWNAPDGEGLEIPMERDHKGGGTWTVSLLRKEDYGKFYKFKLTFHPETAYETVTYGRDPYAAALSANGEKGALVDIKEDRDTLFSGWNPHRKPPLENLEDSVLYELHVRDFSLDPNSGISPEYRGKFMAFTCGETTHPKSGKIKTGIDHLKELGITHVHLLPVYDFATVDETKINDPKHGEKYNWGYDPKNYNAPEGSYSTDPFNPKIRINEFRRMVQAHHDRDIRVVMDVVYNHTHNTDVFDPLVPGYYYRSDELGRYTNGSGCGNEVASERPMVRKFIVDSLKHWATDYNIDGFRFDLMGIIDLETMEEAARELHKINPSIIIYGEPWGGGSTALHGKHQTNKHNLNGAFIGGLKIAEFNDVFRNALRGDNNVPHPSRAYVTGASSNKNQIIRGVAGSMFVVPGDNGDIIIAARPQNTVNYVSCHDNYTLWDQVVSSLGHNFPYPYKPQKREDIKKNDLMEDSRVRRDILANGIVLTSQGIPFIHAGAEMLRTKFGQHNSYNSGDAINEIRWCWKKDYFDVFKYYKGLIQLRKEHPAFRMTTREQVKKHLDILPSPGDTVAFILKDHANGDKWENILVIYNPHNNWMEMNLPAGKWTIVTNRCEAGVTPVKNGPASAERSILLAPISMLVLYQ